ncbi:MAG TPA: hypothetical protein VI789_09200 [Dehalococcoidia bacterium]|nr:hypothetical protein [Dehalococcoidia bacterium]
MSQFRLGRSAIVGAALALALLVPAGAASADGGTDRNCVGALVSVLAREFRPLGVVIAEEARGFEPNYGAVVSEFARTCVLSEP